MTPAPGSGDQLIFVAVGLISALLSIKCKRWGAEPGRVAAWLPFQSPVRTNSLGGTLFRNSWDMGHECALVLHPTKGYTEPSRSLFS